MSLHFLSRLELLLGPEALAYLARCRVAVFGIGGVGSYAAEALARAGVGNIVLVDFDHVCLTNINRQIHALHSTVGRAKVEVMAERIRDINPACRVEGLKIFFGPQAGEILTTMELDYVLDAIDNVTGKIELAVRCREKGIPLIMAMGAGNKLNPAALQVADLFATHTCPLAKVMRKELRRRGFRQGDVKVVFSREEPLVPRQMEVSCRTHCVCTSKEGATSCKLRRQIPGSTPFVPPVMGIMMAAEVVRDLLKKADLLPG